VGEGLGSEINIARQLKVRGRPAAGGSCISEQETDQGQEAQCQKEKAYGLTAGRSERGDQVGERLPERLVCGNRIRFPDEASFSSQRPGFGLRLAPRCGMVPGQL